MRVVVAYDVSNDGRRARLAAVLATWGDRLQRSVFECSLSESDLEDLLARIPGIIEPSTDAVHVFRQCLPCTEVQEQIGQAIPMMEDPYWVL